MTQVQVHTMYHSIPPFQMCQTVIGCLKTQPFLAFPARNPPPEPARSKDLSQPTREKGPGPAPVQVFWQVKEGEDDPLLDVQAL